MMAKPKFALVLTIFRPNKDGEPIPGDMSCDLTREQLYTFLTQEQDGLPGIDECEEARRVLQHMTNCYFHSGCPCPNCTIKHSHLTPTQVNRGINVLKRTGYFTIIENQRRH